VVSAHASFGRKLRNQCESTKYEDTYAARPRPSDDNRSISARRERPNANIQFLPLLASSQVWRPAGVLPGRPKKELSWLWTMSFVSIPIPLGLWSRFGVFLILGWSRVIQPDPPPPPPTPFAMTSPASVLGILRLVRPQFRYVHP
jgi:hypothetical protein